MNDDGAELSGIAGDSNGTPASGAIAMLLADKPGPMRIRSAAADTASRYVLKNIMPGAYKAASVELRSMPDIALSGSFGILEQQAEQIDSKSGDKATRDIGKPARQ